MEEKKKEMLPEQDSWQHLQREDAELKDSVVLRTRQLEERRINIHSEDLLDCFFDSISPDSTRAVKTMSCISSI